MASNSRNIGTTDYDISNDDHDEYRNNVLNDSIDTPEPDYPLDEEPTRRQVTSSQNNSMPPMNVQTGGGNQFQQNRLSRHQGLHQRLVQARQQLSPQHKNKDQQQQPGQQQQQQQQQMRGPPPPIQQQQSGGLNQSNSYGSVRSTSQQQPTTNNSTIAAAVGNHNSINNSVNQQQQQQHQYIVGPSVSSASSTGTTAGVSYTKIMSNNSNMNNRNDQQQPNSSNNNSNNLSLAIHTQLSSSSSYYNNSNSLQQQQQQPPYQYQYNHQQVVSIESPLPTSIQRSLGDRSNEKRKNAALEIEGLIKHEINNFPLIVSIINVLSKDFCTSMNSNYRKGGLVGLAATAIGLLHNASLYLHLLLPPVLHCFDDPESRVRYYACESLYNIAKVSRQAILVPSSPLSLSFSAPPTLSNSIASSKNNDSNASSSIGYFNLIFEGLAKLYADVDVDVKNGANLLDRLIKDIVTEAGNNDTAAVNGGLFPIQQFLPLLQNYIRRTNPYIRQLIVGWIILLDSIPDISMLDYLPDFLDGLFNMLSDSNREIRQAADSALSDFLRELSVSSVIEFGPIISILVYQCKQSTERLNRLTAITWLAELTHHPRSSIVSNSTGTGTATTTANNKHNNENALLPYHTEILSAIMYCISDPEREIRLVAERTNDDLLQLVKDCGSLNGTTSNNNTKQPLFVPLRPLVIDIIGNELHTKDDVATKIASLRWINMLMEQYTNEMGVYTNELLPILLETLSIDSSSSSSNNNNNNNNNSHNNTNAAKTNTNNQNQNDNTVVLLTLQVLSRIALSSSSNDGNDHHDNVQEEKETEHTSMAQNGITNQDYMKTKKSHKNNMQVVLTALLQVFAKDRKLLETRGSLIIRKLCVLLNAKTVYIRLAEILVANFATPPPKTETTTLSTVPAGGADAGGATTTGSSSADYSSLQFISTMVQTLNLILLTASELNDLRACLSQSFVCLSYTSNNNHQHSDNIGTNVPATSSSTGSMNHNISNSNSNTTTGVSTKSSSNHNFTGSPFISNNNRHKKIVAAGYGGGGSYIAKKNLKQQSNEDPSTKQEDSKRTTGIVGAVDKNNHIGDIVDVVDHDNINTDVNQYSDTMVFTKLFYCWCYNPVSTFALCLLGQAYDLSFALIQKFATLPEISVGFLVQMDKLVYLLESPIFIHLRMQLLNINTNTISISTSTFTTTTTTTIPTRSDNNNNNNSSSNDAFLSSSPSLSSQQHYQYSSLLKSIYGILMCLPQGDAYRLLNDRLTTVCNLRDSLVGSSSSTSTPSTAILTASAGNVPAVATDNPSNNQHNVAANGNYYFYSYHDLMNQLLQHYDSVQEQYQQAKNFRFTLSDPTRVSSSSLSKTKQQQQQQQQHYNATTTTNATKSNNTTNDEIIVLHRTDRSTVNDNNNINNNDDDIHSNTNNNSGSRILVQQQQQ